VCIPLRAQRTIKNPTEVSGRGLFTGAESTLRVRPAEPYSGITFIRTDQPLPVRIPAHVQNVSKRARRTALKNGAVTVETVEHCLSACSGLEIDNLEIDMTGDELPAGDGSSLLFVNMLQEAEPCDQEAECEQFVIPEVIRVADRDAELIALPPLNNVDQLEVFYDLDYGEDSPIGRQVLSINVTQERFLKDIAPARTFVLQAEAEWLRENGLGTHLSYSDIVVFGDDGPIQNELRFPNECVRHKILDLVGDLALLGKRISGRIYARKSGHALNHELVRAIIKCIRDTEAANMLLRNPTMDIHRVQRILPHRYPFLMVDRIIEIDGTRRAVGIKNVTINEPYFQGHYPGEPIMPGVLIIEAMAQIGGILMSQELEHKGKIAVLLSLDRVKFRRSVRPGDQLQLVAETVRVTARGGHLKCYATVGAEFVAEASIKFIMTDADAE
jgi:UDP-3-O-[3-hydroxymyristoyl] N-acetylglucosamine deacetylase / 3-hydroxyacyl-[acyl-carrier-protein] dehydratase